MTLQSENQPNSCVFLNDSYQVNIILEIKRQKSYNSGWSRWAASPSQIP